MLLQQRLLDMRLSLLTQLKPDQSGFFIANNHDFHRNFVNLNT